MTHALAKALVAMTLIAAPAWAAGRVGKDPLVGEWVFKFSCAKATEGYAERCASGDRDYFYLSVGHDSLGYCASYELTLQLGNHVDDGVLEAIHPAIGAGSAFNARLSQPGATSQVSMRIGRNRLTWDTAEVKTLPEAASLPSLVMPPHHMVLRRRRTAGPTACHRDELGSSSTDQSH